MLCVWVRPGVRSCGWRPSFLAVFLRTSSISSPSLNFSTSCSAVRLFSTSSTNLRHRSKKRRSSSSTTWRYSRSAGGGRTRDMLGWMVLRAAALDGQHQTFLAPQALLESLHAADAAVLGAAPQIDLLFVLLWEESRQEDGQASRQLTEFFPPLSHQLSWWRRTPSPSSRIPRELCLSSLLLLNLILTAKFQLSLGVK